MLTYKLSQDHLELFYSAVRSRGGFNNNPSPKQFAAIFKRLLIHHELKHVHGNCEDHTITPILEVSSKKSHPQTDDTEILDIERLNIDEIECLTLQNMLFNI